MKRQPWLMSHLAAVGSVEARVAGTGFDLYFTVGPKIAIIAIAPIA